MPIKNKSAGERDMHTVRKALYEYRAVKIVGDSPLFTAFFYEEKSVRACDARGVVSE